VGGTVDSVARKWEKKYVYILLLGHLKCLGDFGVDEGRELSKYLQEIG
jgi:hypothetical protein